jgi:hypothetical protein
MKYNLGVTDVVFELNYFKAEISAIVCNFCSSINPKYFIFKLRQATLKATQNVSGEGEGKGNDLI